MRCAWPRVGVFFAGYCQSKGEIYDEAFFESVFGLPVTRHDWKVKGV